MALPSVAIVILNFNGEKYLKQFLPSVLASTYTNFQVVVADNASTDQSIEFIQNNFPQIKTLQNKTNVGFAGGYNWALKQIDVDYYILLNSDVQVTPNWIEPIIQFMEKNPNVAACQPKIRSYHQPNYLEYAGASGGWMDAFGYPFSRGRVFDILEEDFGQYNNTEPVFWASGAAMFIQSKLFHEAGGFDTYFFAHQEEIDLCWRLHLMGYQIFVCPDSLVYHVGAGTLPRGGRKVFLNFRNNLLMLGKNLPWNEKIVKIPFRFFLDAISAWKGLINGDVYFFTAISKAHLAVIFLWMKGYPSHSFKNIPLKNIQGVYNGSVVWQHFVKHKQFFTELGIKK